MISRTQIMRLLKYKNALRRMKSFGFIKAYSNNLGDAIGITSVQVRKDFSLFNISGNKKGGYNIDDLEKIFHYLTYLETRKADII